MYDRTMNTYKNLDAEDKRTLKLFALGVAGVIAVILFFPIWNSGLGVIGFFDTIIRHVAVTGGIVLGLAALGFATFIFMRESNRAEKASNSRYNRYGDRKTDDELTDLGPARFMASKLWLGIGVVVAGVALIVAPLVLGGYATASQYADGVKTVEEPVNYADRAPWTVSDAFSSRDQGDIIGDRVDVNYVPASRDADAADGEGLSRYTTLIKGRSAFGAVGYAGVQTLDMPTTGVIGNKASHYCEFEGADSGKRLGAFWPGVNMNWSITSKMPAAHWDKDDAYGYCNDGTPVVVVPIWKYEGFLFPTKAPNGAMVFTEGKLNHYNAEELAEEGIAGPTYPRSVAASQRKAINAGGTLADWWGSRYGYDTTEKDDEDTNADAVSEFTMITSDGEMRYVTPLNPRGSSQSMTAIVSIPAVQTKNGLAPTIVNTSPDLPSTSTLATSIKESSVNGDSAWTNRWASGMMIYEILPAQDGHWVASIGQGQAVSYRADIAPDGTIVVTNSDTGQASDGKAEDKDSVTVKSDKALKDMTDEELYETIREATDELESRNSTDE